MTARGAVASQAGLPVPLAESTEATAPGFARLAPLLADETILVSNTSSLPGSLMADASARPDRFVNANFSHLGHQKVEVMPNPGTSNDTVLRTTDFLRATGFVPILLRQEQFGYASNRVWRAVKKEVLRQLGFSARTRCIDRSAFYEVTGVKTNNTQIGFGGWGADYPEGATFLYPLLYGAHLNPDHPNHPARHTGPDPALLPLLPLRRAP